MGKYTLIVILSNIFKYGYDIREKLSRLKQGIKPTNIKTSSRFVGVSWNKEKSTWEARIRYKGKKFHLGCFAVEEDAAKERDRKAFEIYGEQANLNFPEEFTNNNILFSLKLTQ